MVAQGIVITKRQRCGTPAHCQCRVQTWLSRAFSIPRLLREAVENGKTRYRTIPAYPWCRYQYPLSSGKTLHCTKHLRLRNFDVVLGRLVKGSANMDVQNHFRRDATSCSCRKWKSRTRTIFPLSHGADVNALDSRRGSPLHEAIRIRNIRRCGT
jgi:hypothetical protein